MRLALINPCQPYLIEQHTQVPLGLLYLSVGSAVPVRCAQAQLSRCAGTACGCFRAVCSRSS